MKKEFRTSIIIPSLNEEPQIGDTLNSVLTGAPFEVVVVDGGSTDGTVDIVKSFPEVKLLNSEKRGRSLQMNLGAGFASGDVLLFLHADSVLPDGWPALLRDAVHTGGAIGGCFFVTLSNRGYVYRLIGWMINVRTFLFGSFTGDQGIFLTREMFEKFDGFPEVSIMEDLIMADMLRKAGRLRFIRKPILTSARKWEESGPGKTVVLMWYLKLLFRLGRDPEEIAPYYRQGKFPPLSL